VPENAVAFLTLFGHKALKALKALKAKDIGWCRH